MREQKKFHHQIIQTRLKVILGLIKEEKEISQLEREMAFFTLDILNALQEKFLSPKDGSKFFLKVQYALRYEIEPKLSDECCDLINEGMLLDEVDTPYGPDLNLIYKSATKILKRKEIRPKQKFIESLILREYEIHR